MRWFPTKVSQLSRSDSPKSTNISPNDEITLRIALAQSDIIGLQEKTYVVSHPAAALYGQHLTTEEACSRIRQTPRPPPSLPSPTGSPRTVVLPRASRLSMTFCKLPFPWGKANTLLAADFRTFTHVASGTRSVRTLSYAVPAALQAHIRFVHPTVAFIPPLHVPGVAAVKVNHTRRSEAVEAPCIDPRVSCLQAVFGIPSAKANNSAYNVLGVAGYINNFLRNERPNLVGSTFSLQTIDGGTNDQNILCALIFLTRSDLDTQYTIGVPVSFISVGDDSQDGISGFIDIVNSILAMPAEQRPTVLTTSYGFNEQDLPASLAIAVCDAYMSLGAVGISAIFASGDGGVGGVQSTTCTTFVPSAPSGCPLCHTSVGGITNVPPHTAALFSSGGFSNYFPTSSYQAADVAAYLASIGTLYDGLYNRSGRGFPDVSAASHNILIWWRKGALVDGTSCASPIFASMIALVNDRLIGAGKPVLGFLNPFLYSPAGRAAFTDVISGHNPGCNTDGFSALAVWYPLTGLGTPNFDGLLKAVGL
ncbi:family S53 protease-like protein [Mycena alexandri]|uniref:Family S53 protease-like protein n=1 Tax=Mycena alexandri TaxID=1745969 RepID=A0AAD6WRF1_9AGAR|nr:family S53 protease-like protein [Mycena alexandri]